MLLFRVLRCSLLCAPLWGCTTNVVVVDDTYGFERIEDGQALRLQSLRTVIEADPDAAPQGAGRRYRFFLDFLLENRSRDHPWPVQAKGFEVQVAPCDDGTCPQGIAARVAPEMDNLVTVPQRSHARLALPIVVELPPDATIASLERFPLELRYRNEAQEVLLHKRMAVGAFNQVGQAARVVVAFTGALLLLALL